LILVEERKTGETRTRKTWFGIGKEIVEERIEEIYCDMDISGYGIEKKMSVWKEVGDNRAPCADCGEWFPITMLKHCSGDAGCAQCPFCQQKYEDHR